MCNQIGWIVRSTAGHDKDALFFVVGQERKYSHLANGKQRRLAAPKRKKSGHFELLCGQPDALTAEKLRRGEPVTDRELRRALAAFKGGNHAWQKTI